MQHVTVDYSSSGFRLPTEAEWEFACRSGETRIYYWGNGSDETTVKQYAWFNLNSHAASWTIPHASAEGPQPVGQKLPNSFGLRDMAGNVWEWCNDWHARYASTMQTDPSGPGSGVKKVFRGGSWSLPYYFTMSGARNSIEPTTRYSDLGFRVVLVEN